MEPRRVTLGLMGGRGRSSPLSEGVDLHVLLRSSGALPGSSLQSTTDHSHRVLRKPSGGWRLRIKCLLSRPGQISEPPNLQPKLILTEFRGLTLSTPSLVYVYKQGDIFLKTSKKIQIFQEYCVRMRNEFKLLLENQGYMRYSRFQHNYVINFQSVKSK